MSPMTTGYLNRGAFIAILLLLWKLHADVLEVTAGIGFLVAFRESTESLTSESV